MYKCFAILILVFLSGCEKNKTEPDPQRIADQAIAAHGSKLLNQYNVSFTFRKKRYTLERNEDSFVYQRTFTDTTGTDFSDKLINSTELVRLVDGAREEVDQKEATRIKEAVNSVLYFFQLPLGINDAATEKTYAGRATIKGRAYDLVRVTFRQEGGGVDYQDVYMYWINRETSLVDFLAYSYQVNGGGVRFREAINRRVVNGITFQDYVNYKPAGKLTPLEDLGVLFEGGKLEEVSRILSEDIVVQPRRTI